MTNIELTNILESHYKWIATKGSEGQRADFTLYLGREYWTHDYRKVIIDRKNIKIKHYDLSNKDLKKVTFSNITIKNSYLNNTIFNQSEFCESIFEENDVSGSKFEECNFNNSTISNVDFRLSNLSKSTFINSKINSCIFDSLDLSSMDFSRSSFKDCSFVNSNLKLSILSNSTFTSCNFDNSNLERSNFEKTSINNCLIVNLFANNSFFNLSKINNTSFKESNMSGSYFVRSELQNVSFEKSQLIAVNFQGSVIDNVKFNKSILHYSKFNEYKGSITAFEKDSDGYTYPIDRDEIILTRISGSDFSESELDCIYILKSDIKFIPIGELEKYGKTFNCNGPHENLITRELNFPAGYEIIGMSILSHFSEILKNKYNNIKVKVSIVQEAHSVTMVIETPDGKRKVIEKALYDYAMVLAGEITPESFLDDSIQVIKFKHQISLLNAQIEAQGEMLKLTKEHHSETVSQMEFLKDLLNPLVKETRFQSIQCETFISKNGDIMGYNRNVNTGGGNYIESNSGVYIENFKNDDFNDIEKYVKKIEDMLDAHLSKEVPVEKVEDLIAKKLSDNLKKNPTIKDKLVDWLKDLSKSTAQDIVIDITKSAIRLAGIPLP